jgi:uncharacterized lipoprotein YajG
MNIRNKTISAFFAMAVSILFAACAANKNGL